jgi:tetratricopeptide (TPR) repeat protein
MDPAHLGVIARTSVMVYKRDPKPLDEIGHKLGIQYVIEGSVRRDAGRVRITAQLIQLKDQTHVWAKEYDRDLTHLLVLQREIAEEIANETHFALGDQAIANTAHHPAASPPTTSYEAYDLYLKGLYFWNKRTLEGFRQAAQYFQEAIDKDPNYARAYAGLANTFGLMSTWNLVPQNEFMPKARSAALRALQIDDTLAEAHAALALVAENNDYDWQTAEREFRRAIQLDPGYATAHEWYAEYLSWQGRFDEALAESERARQLDPLSLIIATDRATIFYYSRQYDRAIAQCHAVLDMDSGFALARIFLFFSLVKEGNYPEALEDLEQDAEAEKHYGPAPHGSPQVWAEKTYLFGEWDRTTEAQRAFATFEKIASQLHDRRQSSILANVGTRRKDQAIALLQQAYEEHSSVVTSIKVDPRYDLLRDQPKFQELLRRVWPSQ